MWVTRQSAEKSTDEELTVALSDSIGSLLTWKSKKGPHSDVDVNFCDRQN